MGCQDCQAPRGTGAQLGSQGSWGTEVSQVRMGSQGSRVHRALGAPLDFQGLQGSLADVGPWGLRGRLGLKDPQEYLAFEVTRGLVVWLGNLGSQERGGFQGLMDPLDRLGPKVNRVSQAALGDQGWQEPWDRRVTWGSLGSLA